MWDCLLCRALGVCVAGRRCDGASRRSSWSEARDKDQRCLCSLRKVGAEIRGHSLGAGFFSSCFLAALWSFGAALSNDRTLAVGMAVLGSAAAAMDVVSSAHEAFRACVGARGPEQCVSSLESAVCVACIRK